MKKLSDYKNEDAVELWADLMEPILIILADEETSKLFAQKPPALKIAKELLKTHPKEVTEVLTIIDPTPVDGLNLMIRTVDVVLEIMNNKEVLSFFGPAESEEK